MITPRRLWIPPKTRLMTVWQLPGGQWQVFTACPDAGAPFNKMIGTSLILDPDGAAYRSVTRPDGNDLYEQVMPPMGE